MMRKLLSSFSVLIILALAIYKLGLYPVVSVNGALIFARTWQHTLDAEKRVVNVHAGALGAHPVDFSSPKNAQLLDVIRRRMLTFLIDAVLIKKEGTAVVPDLERLSSQRVNDEVRNSLVTEQTAWAVYGLDLATLKNMVLMPQAQQEILSEALAAKQKNFDDWLLDAREHAKVKLFFVPFRWSKEGVQ